MSRISDALCLGKSRVFVYLTKSQVILMLLVQIPQFEDHWSVRIVTNRVRWLIYGKKPFSFLQASTESVWYDDILPFLASNVLNFNICLYISKYLYFKVDFRRRNFVFGFFFTLHLVHLHTQSLIVVGSFHSIPIAVSVGVVRNLGKGCPARKSNHYGICLLVPEFSVF